MTDRWVRFGHRVSGHAIDGIPSSQHPQALSILNKWSAKIQAATILQAGGKSSTKFSTGDQLGAVELIDNSLSAKVCAVSLVFAHKW